MTRRTLKAAPNHPAVRPARFERAWAAALGLAVLSLAGCGDEEALGLGEPDPLLAGPTIDYAVEVEAVSREAELPGDLRGYLGSVSQAAQTTDRPPASFLVLRNRAEDDLERLRDGLRARGYYEGEVTYEIRQEREVGDEGRNGNGLIGQATGLIAQAGDQLEGFVLGAPVRLVYLVEPGPLYRFGPRQTRVGGEASDYRPPRPVRIGLREGEPAIAENVVEAEDTLVRDAKTRGYPFAEAGEREVILDADAKTMEVRLTVIPGPKAEFGRFDIDGDEDISARLLRSRIGIDPGDTFNIDRLEEARQALIETNLFSVVRVEPLPPEAMGEDGQLPVYVGLTPRPFNSAGLALGYFTETGPRASVFYENRNLSGGGERLRVELQASQIQQEFFARFRKPDLFLVRNLDLVADGSLSYEDTDAYQAEQLSAGIGLERRFDRHLTGTIGVAYNFVRVEDVEGDEDNELFGLLSVPTSLSWDYSDDLLDPSQGFRLGVRAAPYIDTLGLGTQFFKAQATGTAYARLTNDPRLVAAFRLAGGTALGAGFSEVPATERYYSGGGGSVRGIPYQLASPLVDGEPIGGLSFVETSVELRYELFEGFEVATFLDGGSAFRDEVPEELDLRFGAGLGLRYLSPIGPIRFDVAVPLDKRNDVDDPFQIYISIGQAF